MKADVGWFAFMLLGHASFEPVSLSGRLHALDWLISLFANACWSSVEALTKVLLPLLQQTGSVLCPRLLVATKGLCGSHRFTEVPCCPLTMICVKQLNVQRWSFWANYMGIEDFSTLSMRLQSWAQEVTIWFKVIASRTNFLDTYLNNFQLTVKVSEVISGLMCKNCNAQRWRHAKQRQHVIPIPPHLFNC